MESSASPRAYRSALRTRQAQETRERVIETAGALFSQQGYQATTISAIARAADVSAETVKATASKPEMRIAAFEVRLAAAAGRTPAPRLLVNRLRRMRRNPYATALHEAARQGDLMTLRAVADDYARAETSLGRDFDRSALRELDGAIFSDNSPRDFDRAAFLRRMTGR